MKSFEFECEDRYEAEKLGSLVSIQKDGSVWVTGIAAIIEREIVIQLKDRSSHAVVMKTRQEARRLGELLSDIVAGISVLKNSERTGPNVKITLG